MITSAHDRRLRQLAGGLALSAMLLVGAAPAAAATGLERQVLDDINAIRAAHGLGGVRDDGGLAAGARSYSRSMVRHGFFAHGNWYPRVRSHAGTGTVGEILGYLPSVSARHEARVVVNAWMRSGSHRTVILSRSFGRAGVGRAWSHRRGRKTVIYTVDFAAG